MAFAARVAEDRSEGGVNNQDRCNLTQKNIERLAVLSFREGQGILTDAEKQELQARSAVDHHLHSWQSAELNRFMTAAFKLGKTINRGAA